MAAASPAAVDGDADAVAAIARRLTAIPVAPAAAGPVLDWLAGWSRFVSERHQMATDLRSDPRRQPPASLVDQVTAQAAQIDAFALSNGMWACTLLAADRAPAG
jgi:hypothetical protein